MEVAWLGKDASHGFMAFAALLQHQQLCSVCGHKLMWLSATCNCLTLNRFNLN
jgi:hypothetical protein